MASSKRVFISHIHEDDEHIKAMRDLLGSKGFDMQVSAVDSSNPNNAKDADYIKSSILSPKIDWAQTMLVLISPGTKESDWVDWEIEYAHQHDKRIVGVWVSGAAETDIPPALAEYADAVVGWQADRIDGAINGSINNWTGSDGRERDRQEIRRYSC